MRRSHLVVSLVLLPAALIGQKNAPKPPKPCIFDTAAHTDTLTVEFSVAVFREKAATVDSLMSRALGDMIRAHFAAPRSIGQLLFPNTYDARRGFTASAGTLQFTLRRDGTLANRQWFAASMDPSTDAALDLALDAAVAAGEPRDLVPLLGGGKQQMIRVHFIATTRPGMYAPLARLRAPMVRVDSIPTVIPDHKGFAVPGGPLADPGLVVEFTVSELGNYEKNSLQIVNVKDKQSASAFLANMLDQHWTPASVAGCPVRFRIASRVAIALR